MAKWLLFVAVDGASRWALGDEPIPLCIAYSVSSKRTKKGEEIQAFTPAQSKIPSGRYLPTCCILFLPPNEAIGRPA